MTKRDDIVGFCNKLLRVKEIEDAWCENGLQVEGPSQVKRIALGVSATLEFLKKAASWGAEMCIVHHGLFWTNGVKTIDGVMKKRLQVILSHDISLVNYHIPLDAHPEIGNNAALIRLLSLKNIQPVECGFLAELKRPMGFQEFVKLVKKKLGRVNFSADFSGEKVKRVGVISGGAADFAGEVKEAGADTFLFGELHEKDYHALKEMNLSFVAAGHFNTERLGVQFLGKEVMRKFRGIEVKFFDEDCPV